jgi:hypothetical protein
MDADITQNYPEIWQLFLGAVLVLILFGLPGGIVGFILQRDVGSGDDRATRLAKMLGEFRRKSWMFFLGSLLFTSFFAILHQPAAWLLPRARTFVAWSLPTWGIVPCALLQLAIVGGILWLLLRRADRFERVNGVLLLALPIGVLALNVWLATPLSGLLIVLLWAIFATYSLGQADFRHAYGIGRAAGKGD